MGAVDRHDSASERIATTHDVRLSEDSRMTLHTTRDWIRFVNVALVVVGIAAAVDAALSLRNSRWFLIPCVVCCIAWASLLRSRRQFRSLLRDQ